MGGMTVLMTVSSASTLFGGGDVDNLVERTSPIIQSRPPKAIECQPAMSVWVTVLHYSMRAIAPSPQGFSPSIDNRVGILDPSAILVSKHRTELVAVDLARSVGRIMGRTGSVTVGVKPGRAFRAVVGVGCLPPGMASRAVPISSSVNIL